MNSMNYKAGNKVRVRKGLIPDTLYGGVFFTDLMLDLCGETLTIKNVCLSKNFYYVEEYDFVFSDEMLEDIEVKGESMREFKIKNYNTYNDRVVVVTFEDGSQEKAVCNEADNFDLENGVCVCVMKHIFGETVYKSMIKTAMKQIKELDKAEEKEKERKELIERKRAKAARKKARRKERERAERIEDMTAAFVKAINKCCDNDCDEWDNLK